MENQLYIAEFEAAEGNAEKEMELWRKYNTIYQAYRDSKKAENAGLNFYEIIREQDVKSIIDLCKKDNIAEITISGVSSNLIEILANFEKHNCKLNGITSVKDRFNGCTVPALVIKTQ